MLETISVSKPNVLSYSCYRQFLKDLSHFNRVKNPSWSFSIWARKLEIKSKSMLTMVLSGERNLSQELAEKMTAVLALTSDEKAYFLHLVNNQKRNVRGLLRLEPNQDVASDTQISRRWLILVLLDLCQLEDFTPEAEWIKQRLLTPCSVEEISAALLQMKRDQLLVEDQFGKLSPNYPAVQSRLSKMSKSELLQFHEDGNQAAVESLLRLEKSQRQFLTSILRVSPAKLEEANAIMAETQRRLGALLEDGSGSEIYELHLQLFPITQTKP